VEQILSILMYLVLARARGCLMQEGNTELKESQGQWKHWQFRGRLWRGVRSEWGSSLRAKSVLKEKTRELA